LEPSVESLLSSLLKDDLVAYFELHPQKIRAVIQLAKSSNPPHSARAAWLLSKMVRKKNIKIKRHIPDILHILPLVEDGQKRDLINVLRALNLNEKEEGTLYDISITIWSDPGKIPSVRITAFRFILELCNKFPELGNEIILLTEDYYLESLSPGIKRIVHRLINDFKKENQL